MSPEDAREVIASAPPDTATLSPQEARKLREAHLVMRGDFTEDEMKNVLEAEFGPLD